MDVKLVRYDGQTDVAVGLIQAFWQSHNQYTPSHQEALEDLSAWTAKGHCLYLISHQQTYVGFVHLGSRGCEMDWLEDIFVLPALQGKGIGSEAIRQVEAIVKAYSETLYIKAAAKNDRAVRLYHRLGYTCLNTITIRKDFRPEKYQTVGVERIMGLDLDVKQDKGS